MSKKYLLLLTAILLWAVLTMGGFWMFQKSKETKKDASFATLDRGIQSSVNVPTRKVLKKQKEWEELWAEIHPIIENNPSLARPEIDWEKEMVLAIFMGFKSTGGYTTEITKIIETKNSLEVTVLEKGPESNTIVTQVFTSPYHLVKTVRTNKSVIFQIEKPLETVQGKTKERPKQPDLIPQTLQNRLNPLD